MKLTGVPDNGKQNDEGQTASGAELTPIQARAAKITEMARSWQDRASGKGSRLAPAAEAMARRQPPRTATERRQQNQARARKTAEKLSLPGPCAVVRHPGAGPYEEADGIFGIRFLVRQLQERGVYVHRAGRRFELIELVWPQSEPEPVMRAVRTPLALADLLERNHCSLIAYAPIPVMELSAGMMALADIMSGDWLGMGTFEMAVSMKFPDRALATCVQSGHWPRTAELAGIGRVPFMTADQRLITEPGFDWDSGMFLLPARAEQDDGIARLYWLAERRWRGSLKMLTEALGDALPQNTSSRALSARIRASRALLAGAGVEFRATGSRTGQTKAVEYELVLTGEEDRRAISTLGKLSSSPGTELEAVTSGNAGEVERASGRTLGEDPLEALHKHPVPGTLVGIAPNGTVEMWVEPSEEPAVYGMGGAARITDPRFSECWYGMASGSRLPVRLCNGHEGFDKDGKMIKDDCDCPVCGCPPCQRELKNERERSRRREAMWAEDDRWHAAQWERIKQARQMWDGRRQRRDAALNEARDQWSQACGEVEKIEWAEEWAQIASQWTAKMAALGIELTLDGGAIEGSTIYTEWMRVPAAIRAALWETEEMGKAELEALEAERPPMTEEKIRLMPGAVDQEREAKREAELETLWALHAGELEAGERLALEAGR